jgi:hypothetical protein
MQCFGLVVMPSSSEPLSFLDERAELARLLSSKSFGRATNLTRMLSYVCEQYFQGIRSGIKEYQIAVEALGRRPNFDPTVDSIVRVEATNLRKRLNHYYATEGADHEVRIHLSANRYEPVFERRAPTLPSETFPADADYDADLRDGSQVAEPDQGGNGSEPALETEGARTAGPAARIVALLKRPLAPRRLFWVASLSILLVLAVTMAVRRGGPSRISPPSAASAAESAWSETDLRIVCGFSGEKYVDASGRAWLSDRYFSGGTVAAPSDKYIFRTPDQTIYRTPRRGDFRYDIPLKPGVYELHLHFVETDFGEGNPQYGGEGSRRFSVSLNDQVVLGSFDILSDAGGPNTADERVLKDVSPGADGFLRLGFRLGVASPLLNAIEILPSSPGRTRPVRIVCGGPARYHGAGMFWEADNYFLGGQKVAHVRPVYHVAGTDDLDLYGTERWGNFSYAIPVAEGVYRLRLRFSEGYFGSSNSGSGGVGSRVFDVHCNGVNLLKDFDIFKEAGGERRGIVMEFRGLRPNAQGKLLITFVPRISYATVAAIEVLDYSQP